jgi:hypothetical protein
MGTEQFVGTWKLVSFEFRTSTGRVFYPYSQDAFGILMYDAHGNMNGQIMRPDRPAFASGDLMRGTPEEIKAAFEGFVGYFGTYEVHEEEGAVIHHVTDSVFPNYVGENQVRFFQFSGNRLSLSTPPIQAGGVTLTGVIVWERI